MIASWSCLAGKSVWGRERTLRKSSSIGAVALLAILNAGCSARQDVMRPVDIGTAGTRKVDMLVATTRQPTQDPALMYSGERGEELSLANVVVSIPPEGRREAGTIQWPDSNSPDPLSSFVTLKAEPMRETQVLGWFRRNAGPKRKALIFVHGFNNGFADATYRLAQLANDLGTSAAPVLFTWPSRGNALDYVYDRESTIYSRFGLVKVLKEAIASPDVSEISVVAHSMGGWLTMEALREIGLRDGKLSGKVKTVVLASPDIDVDVFRRQVLEMGPQRPSFLVVNSRNDLALSVSRWIAGDVDRLGGADLRSHKELLTRYGISVIDATDEAQTDTLGHNAFAESDVLLRRLGEGLNRSIALRMPSWRR